MAPRRRLRYLLAGSAPELLPNMLCHEPLRRNDLKHLGDVRILRVILHDCRGQLPELNSPLTKSGGADSV